MQRTCSSSRDVFGKNLLAASWLLLDLKKGRRSRWKRQIYKEKLVPGIGDVKVDAQYRKLVVSTLADRKLLKIEKLRKKRSSQPLERATFLRYAENDKSESAKSAKAYLRHLGITPSEYFSKLV